METYILVHFVTCTLAVVLNFIACFSAENKGTLLVRLLSVALGTAWAVWGGILMWAK